MAVDERPADDLVYEIEPSVQEELIKHPGKWVAMRRSRILAIRDTPAEAYAAGREAGVGVPILYQVPDTRARYSYFQGTRCLEYRRPTSAPARMGWTSFATLPPSPGGSGPGGSLDVRPCKGIMRWDAENAILMTEFLVVEPGKGPDTVLLGRADFFKLYVPRFHWHRDPPVFDLDPVTTGRR